jgi:pilus assembly protein CpaB
MAAILPKSMRAVAITIAPDTDAGGFILPEDYVDIVLTRHDRAQEQANGVEALVSETLLENVRVLAVDQTAEEKGGQKVVLGKTATLEVTQPQAETLALARQQGTLSLALRSLIDSKPATPEPGPRRKQNGTTINLVRFGVGGGSGSTASAAPPAPNH